MCDLSLIIPAYNEAHRLPAYLQSVRAYFDQELPARYEVIVVAEWPQLRSITHRRNSGKGSAMRTGAQSAIGKLLLFTDADGATPIEFESVLREAIDGGADVATGVRCGSDLRGYPGIGLHAQQGGFAPSPQPSPKGRGRLVGQLLSVMLPSADE